MIIYETWTTKSLKNILNDKKRIFRPISTGKSGFFVNTNTALPNNI